MPIALFQHLCPKSADDFCVLSSLYMPCALPYMQQCGSSYPWTILNSIELHKRDFPVPRKKDTLCSPLCFRMWIHLRDRARWIIHPGITVRIKPTFVHCLALDVHWIQEHFYYTHQNARLIFAAVIAQMPIIIIIINHVYFNQSIMFIYRAQEQR